MAKPKLVDPDRLEYERVMGAELGARYVDLYEELLWLHSKWRQYRELYAADESIALLNASAPYFFGVVQNVLWRDIILHLARLVDPPRSAGKDNLSLPALPAAIPDVVLKDAIVTQLTSLVDKAAFARDWRNRRLAHNDLALALQRAVAPLPQATEAHVCQVLKAMRTLMNTIEVHYCQAENVYEVSRGHGAKWLLRILRGAA